MIRRWTAGPVACYYGCQLVRPYGEADPRSRPVRMDEVLRAAGVPTVDYALKTRCCGGIAHGHQPPGGRTAELHPARRKPLAKGRGPCVTVCPLCQYNLDAYQSEIRRETHEHFDMPDPLLHANSSLGIGSRPAGLGLRRSISGRKAIAQWFTQERTREVAYV